MRRSVFAERDAVVRKHVYDVQAHERREPDRRTHVVGEDEKCRAVGQGASVRSHAVDDCAHRVLANAKVHVAPGVAPAAAS